MKKITPPPSHPLPHAQNPLNKHKKHFLPPPPSLLPMETNTPLKRRVELKHKTNMKPRQFKVVDLVMQKAYPYEIENLSPKWTDPFLVVEALGNNAYKLETLEGGAISRMWNTKNLKFYFS